MKERLREFSTWLALYNNTIKFIGGCVVVVGATSVYLTLYINPWFAAVGALLIGLGVGIGIGITIHRTYASRRNAPLGYRIEKVTHDFRLDHDDPRVFHRVLTRQITSKRDQLYVVDGRMRTDADEVQLVECDPPSLIEPDGRKGELNHYMVIFERELNRGDVREIRIAQDFVYTSKLCAPEYVHTAVVWAHEINFRLQFPPQFIDAKSVRMYEVDGRGRGSSRSRELRSALTHDEMSGVIVGLVKNPVLGRHYEIVWKWTADYQDALKAKWYN